ncbi:ImmA/IrrE family metallo-endopeptidase [Weissella fangxianensis]|uniref:ImmA/IrrE family metallo-endopeptidase n=1 Tax=Weissella fangxianensis TaxID=2953879 RepID=UPI002157947E|nr:ImmA/IrrE family metallo-endopeptidase [Weissella fangxianensis]
MIDILDYLLYLCRSLGINYKISDELDSSIPDISVPSQRKIIINANYDTNVEVAFRLAHEISHVMLGNYEENCVYQFSIGTRKRSEHEANENAVKILGKFVYADTPVEYRNYVNFMNEFGLPSSFEPMVEDIIKEI